MLSVYYQNINPSQKGRQREKMVLSAKICQFHVVLMV